MVSYEDADQVGEGAFGVVYRCNITGHEDVVARKELRRGATAETKKRFAREVRLLATLDHPNVVKVVARQLTDDPYWYAMPMYQDSLESRMKELVDNQSDAAQIFERVMDGIEYAHSQGVVHRDLKPANVLLNSPADVVITDFGLGRLLTASSTRNTMTGQGLGTLLYMAPEQFSDAKEADERSDIFALGRMLLEMYTGHLSVGEQDLSSVPIAIRAIIRRCTQAKVEDRFQSVYDLKVAWRSARDVGTRATSFAECEKLIAELATSDAPDAGRVNLFAGCIAPFVEDTDLVHKAVMELDTAVFAVMSDVDREVTVDLVTRFVRLVTSQGWGFDYVDRLGNKCYALHSVISDPDIRAQLAFGLVALGCSHNRWHVMRLAAVVLEAMREPAEMVPTAQLLAQLPSHYFSGDFLRRVNLGRLTPDIRVRFPPSD